MVAVVVAGGATGIGASVVRALRSRGDQVVLIDINRDAGQVVAAEQAPGPCWFIEADFSKPTNALLALTDAAEILSGLDVLFYNAGYLLAKPLAEWTLDDWENSEAVNLQSPFFMVQAAAPYLRKSSRGRVILTSSTGGLRGHAGMPAYHATKAGVIGLVRSLADELGPAGITVNALCPGWVDTSFNDEYWDYQTDRAVAVKALEASIPLRRQAKPDEVAKTVLFLVDEASSYVTGQALVVDGGYTAV
jgi:dihydroanticapsin dehydrogenase